MLRKGMFISDRYEIIDKVGSGGMSDVYKAKCHKLNRYVAIKVLKPEFSEDKNFVSKFKVEAQSAAGLAHPNIVSVFDVGEDNGLHYIVMELVEGITLKKYIEKKGRLSVKEAVSIAIQVAQGIEAAHNNHIIHRDIKPQNIIISREGKVKVTDFGIARAASANTINSNAMGSVHYISPEQARGGFIDEKSDIYSLGITLYEMITGSVPFEGDTTVTIALQHIQGEIPPAKNVVEDLPISVEKIIEKCTQKKPDRRYLKVSSLIADLKKSLITPDEDFVQMVPEQNNQSTVIISDDDVALIRRETGMSTEPEEDMIDDTTAEISSLNPEDEDIDDDIEDEEEDNPKLDKIVAIGGIVTGVLILAVVVFLAVSIFKNGVGGKSATDKKSEKETTLDAKHTKMPDLTGCTEEEAIKKIKAADLGYQIESQNSNTVEEGYVISASIEYGKVIEKNTSVVIQISLGAQPVDMPTDLVGKTKDEAIEILDKLNLHLTYDIEYKEDDSVEMDTVMSTEPAPPSQIKYGDTIVINVSKGTSTSTDAIVPSVVGLTEDAARTTLSSANLTLGKVEHKNSDSVTEGLIISQDVKKDEKLPAGTSINVVISDGPEKQSTVPDIRNRSESEARSLLEAQGLTLGSATGSIHSESVAEGLICEQSIAAGTQVAPGTTVNYTLSLGGETTKAAAYNASVNINKSDITSKLTPDEDGNYTGKVSIEIDGASYNDFPAMCANLEDWPDSWTLELPEREEGGTAIVEIFVNGSSVFTYGATYKN